MQWEVLSLLPWEHRAWEEGHIGQVCQQRNQTIGLTVGVICSMGDGGLWGDVG